MTAKPADANQLDTDASPQDQFGGASQSKVVIPSMILSDQLWFYFSFSN